MIFILLEKQRKRDMCEEEKEAQGISADFKAFLMMHMCD